jgi:hypothetical protein
MPPTLIAPQFVTKSSISEKDIGVEGFDTNSINNPGVLPFGLMSALYTNTKGNSLIAKYLAGISSLRDSFLLMLFSPKSSKPLWRW